MFWSIRRSYSPKGQQGSIVISVFQRGFSCQFCPDCEWPLLDRLLQTWILRARKVFRKFFHIFALELNAVVTALWASFCFSFYLRSLLLFFNSWVFSWYFCLSVLAPLVTFTARQVAQILFNLFAPENRVESNKNNSQFLWQAFRSVLEKNEMSFISLGRSVLGKTVPSVLST